MSTQLGAIIAERRLERPRSARPVRARLGHPRPSRKASWECPYQVLGIGDGRVRLGLGEDPLQSLLNACAGLRVELLRVRASWMSEGVSGIPPFVPDVFGAKFTAHLEGLIEREVRKLTSKLQHAYEAKQKRLNRVPSNKRVKPTASNSRGAVRAVGPRGLCAVRWADKRTAF